MSLSAQPKTITIKKNAEIKDVIASGKKTATKFGVFFLQCGEQNVSVHYAVLIKKNAGNAVHRNYCKRIVREYIRKRQDRFSAYQKIIFLYTYKGKISYSILEEEFDKHLKFR